MFIIHWFSITRKVLFFLVCLALFLFLGLLLLTEWMPVSLKFLSPSHFRAEHSVLLPWDAGDISKETQDADETTRRRRDKVRELFAYAWKSYEAFAWGYNELDPLNKVGKNALFGGAPLGATIVDSLDTAYLMGLVNEYQKGKDWIGNNLDFDKNASVSVFEITIRMLGGLLSLHALTRDPMYLVKAIDLADRLLPAFNSSSGVPYANINLRTSQAPLTWECLPLEVLGLPEETSGSIWAPGSILSEFGSLHLEFVYLSHLTKNPTYSLKVHHVRRFIANDTRNGLFPTYYDNEKGRFFSGTLKIGAEADSFYEYLLKAWIQSNKIDSVARKMYDDAVEGILKVFLKKSKNLYYLANEEQDIMEHLTCFAAGMLALGSYTKMDKKGPTYFNLGEKLAEACHKSYEDMPTHLGPESFSFRDDLATTSNPKYLLRPEAVESYFILWRLTHNVKYREWGWEAVEAIERFCKSESGYHGLRNIDRSDPIKDDTMQTFFLAETLKYLYLLFSSDDLLPLDLWVFNTEAHPFPIIRTHFYMIK